MTIERGVNEMGRAAAVCARTRGHAWVGLFFLVWAVLAGFELTIVPSSAHADSGDRIIVLGFDGADSELTETWMASGDLPNLAALRDRGTFTPLLPTNPPQTPVSWSTFSTGLDPGTTEIFDFLKRMPGTYLPDFALMTQGRQTLLWGERNGLLVALVGFGAGLLLSFVVLGLARVRGAALLGGGLVPALLLGAVGYKLGSDLLPHEIPDAINNRRGLTYWDLADQAGIRTTTIRVPTTFPASDVANGKFISGLGVPDIRGRIGTPSMYTSEEPPEEGDNDFSIEFVSIDPRGRSEVKVFGPKNLPFYDYKLDKAEQDALAAGKNGTVARQVEKERLREKGVAKVITLPAVMDVDDTGVDIEVGDYAFRLAEGEWSEWLNLEFPFNRIMKAKGIGRFKVESLDPVKVYFSPIHFDPASPPPSVKICHPHDLTQQLAEKNGPFKTMGWSIDTWSLDGEQISEATFIEDVNESIAHFRKMFDEFIEEEGSGIFTQIFYFTDRVQHMLWRLRDVEHPKYDAAKADQFEEEIFLAYKKMDDIVGEAMAKIGPDTHLIVVSDHGFSTWRRAMNLNTWLARNGFMTLTGEGETKDLEALFDRGDFWPNVDWSRTKAFALGLGYIYVNVLGREPQGTVLPGPEYEKVCRELKEGLQAYRDPVTGDAPVSRVYHRTEMYREGFDEELIPDLRVSNNPGYRVSWQSSLGNTPAEIMYDVEKNWSGDHCSLDPKYVKGILFTSFAHQRAEPWMGDVFPTVCDLLDLGKPEKLHGVSLLGN